MNYHSTPKPLLIYLHGFMSSPNSVKAKEAAFYLAKRSMVLEYIAVPLADGPQQALAQLEQLMIEHKHRPIGLIGSSLGGFYASVLTARYGCKAVLVNPVVAPHKLMQKYLGEQENPYTHKRFSLTPNDIEFLQALDVECPKPENILLFVQTGDETLNYQHAVSRYQGAVQIVEEGGDHRFQAFDRHMPSIIDFLFSSSTVINDK